MSVADISIEFTSFSDIHALKLEELVKEYATTQEATVSGVINADYLRMYGIGSNKCFECIIGVNSNSERLTGNIELVGFAMFSYAYSTFQGRSSCLQAIYVRPQYRRKGIGSGLLKKAFSIAAAKGCVRMDCAVKQTNFAAVSFLQQFRVVDLTEKEEWLLYRFNQESLQALAT